MSNEIKIFEHDKFGEIRVIDRDGEPWFVAKDICTALGFEKPSDAVRGLDEDEKDAHIMRGTSGNPDKTIVSESGLYSLIMRSRKKEAKAFKRWVTHEVLPSIRKHGTYMTDSFLNAAMADPRHMIEVLTVYANEREKRKELEAREEIWGTRTPFGEISKRTGKPKVHPVRGYPRSSRRDPEYIITTITETQMRLFNPYGYEDN